MKWLSLPALAMSMLALTFASCSKTGDDGNEKTFDVHGKVISVDLGKKEVTVDHDDIPGLMKAMRMPFKVENARILEGIKAGDQIHGKLKVKDGQQTITELMKH
jgi:protein SCO1/2